MSTFPLALLALAASAVSPPPPVPAQSQLSPADPSAPAGLMVGLVLRDPAGLDALIAAQHDPKSPSFRRWLTPAQFGDRFGLDAARYASLADALGSTGLRIQRYPSRLLLHARGSVGQVEQLLGIRIYDVHTAAGKHFRTYRGSPALPAGFGAEIQSLSGLDTRPHFHRRLDVGPYDSFGPQDLRRYYDIAPVQAQGFAGQLSSVGVIGPIPDDADLPDPADLHYFYANASDAPVSFKLVNLGLQGSDPDDQGDKGELEMDAELSTVAAPLEQSVTMVLGPQDDFFVQDMGYFANVEYTVTAVSVSYGNCEAEEAGYPDELHTVADLAAQASAEGQSWFAASGDDGADDCETGPKGAGGDGPQVDFPGSVPYFVSVGGTSYTGSFDSNHAIPRWGGEVVWNNDYGAGGGGTSQLFAKPGYQRGLGDSARWRDVPDFSLLADPNVSVAVDDTRPGLLDGSGGTSDAAPMAAGIFALINDAIGGCGIGAPQFELYRLGRTGAPVFHDVVSGNLDMDGITGPRARAGFDDASGWGSLDVANLVRAWPPCDGTGTARPAPAYPDGGWPLDDAGFFDPGPYDGGLAPEDAGPRAPFDACAALDCGGGAVCETVPEGPSRCVLACRPDAGAGCPSGEYCDGVQDRCLPGCGRDADCTGGLRCESCTHECVGARPDGGVLGGPCQQDADCATFGICLPPDPDDDLPDGYCSQACDSTVPACQCPDDAVCADGLGGICLASCSVSQQSGCSFGQVCNDFNGGDVGVCLPPCRTDADCDFGTVQDTCVRGICRPPAVPLPDAGAPIPPVYRPPPPPPAPADSGCSTAGGGLGLGLLLVGLGMLARRRRTG